ncbi:TPA: glycosyltransferase [Photobacterium damselae]
MKLIKRFYRTFFPKKPIRNLGYNGQRKKKVLISYLLDAFELDIEEFKYSTNRQEMLAITSAFIELGYQVDIQDCLSNHYNNKVNYDIVFGFGVPYRKAKLSKDGIRILYCTEGHPDFSLENETKQIEYFQRRHSVKYKVERSGVYYCSFDYDIADELFVMGEHNQKYLIERGFKNVSGIVPTAIDVHKEILISEERSFIWLGSRGIVHKGLDLLVDVFNKRNDKLHICGVTKDYFYSKTKIIAGDNIFFHGKVDVNSSFFNNELLPDSSFIIMPSCSEGVSTSVLTGMKFGLIPLVSTNCGIDVNKFGKYVFDSLTIESVENLINSTKQLSNRDLLDLKQKIYNFAKVNFNLPDFEDKFKKLLLERTKL